MVEKKSPNENEIDVKKLVGKRIREYRKMRGMSQETLSEIIEIDSKHLSNIELGQTRSFYLKFHVLSILKSKIYLKYFTFCRKKS